MSLHSKSQLDLLQLANAGAAFAIDAAHKTQLDLVQLANAVRMSGGHLTVSGSLQKTQLDLLQLANAGKGHITFST
ncbi:hypothetical protein [Pseudomonas putida]